MKHLLFEIVEATEAAAIAASKLVGSGDKVKIDKVATDAMKARLDLINFSAEVVIGEGIKDGSVGLFKGDRVGLSSRTRSWDSRYSKSLEPPPHDDPEWKLCDYEYDIAVDPVDGTTQTAKGGYEAMSVLAIGGKGCLLPAEEFYMEKMAYGKPFYPGRKGMEITPSVELSFNQSYENIVGMIKFCTNKKQITVCMLDRPRHEKLAATMRALGCRIRFIQDCDVSGAIAAAMPESGIDLFVGIGGAPEGVITAAAMKCLGGQFIGRLVDNKEYKPVDDKVYDIEALAKGDVMFAATGITNGSLLAGVKSEEVNWGTARKLSTHSILMNSKTKSFKRIESYYVE